jgi:glycosyltransferase involved in cell wall biosynthesis
MSIKVSICIPAYKQISFLRKCLESVLMQDYSDYELIITDDSPDDSVKQLVNELLSNKPHTYLQNKPALGSPANWNKGISLAKGEYIKIMHHDDSFCEKESLSEFVRALDTNQHAQLVFSNSKVVHQNGTSRIHVPNESQLKKLKQDPMNLFLGNFIGAPSATIYRRNASVDYDVNLKWLVDIDFYMRVLNKNNSFVHINKALVATTDGAEHQVTSESLNNPNVELKENCYVFEKLSIPRALEKDIKDHFSELFSRFDINNIESLKKYAPGCESKKEFYNTVFSELESYKKKKSSKKLIKSMIKNPFTIALYQGYVSTKAKGKIKEQLKLFKDSAKRTKARFSLKKEDELFCADDNTINTGFDRHYVYHLAWAARIVKEINPKVHSDISSLLFFPTMLSAFVKVNFYDYRPAQLNLDNLNSEKCDLTKLHFESNSIESLSCMHTVEHIGLGRYGDPIDYDGDLKAIEELKRVVKAGGNLLFVVPIGKARIQYNAHRIYSYAQIIGYFTGFELKEFSLIPDTAQQGGLIRNASEEQSNRQEYGCGCFWFIKK